MSKEVADMRAVVHMIANALKRDAEKGKLTRGEMRDDGDLDFMSCKYNAYLEDREQNIRNCFVLFFSKAAKKEAEK